jgi:hypothetical protein
MFFCRTMKPDSSEFSCGVKILIMIFLLHSNHSMEAPIVFITHIEAGFNNEANTGKVFLALAEPVAINKIKSRLEYLWAFEVNCQWRAFPSNNNNASQRVARRRCRVCRCRRSGNEYQGKRRNHRSIASKDQNIVS